MIQTVLHEVKDHSRFCNYFCLPYAHYHVVIFNFIFEHMSYMLKENY